MFDEPTTEILLKFLDKKTKDAEEEIAEKGTLSEEHAIPLILKTLFNHVAHLDMEITTLRELMDKRFKQVDKGFEQVDKRFGQVEKRFGQVDAQLRHLGSRIAQLFTGITLGFSVLAFLIILFGFLK